MKNRVTCITAIVWSVTFYAAETWPYKQEDIRRLEAFEMWVWRKMEKIFWRDMKTNEEVHVGYYKWYRKKEVLWMWSGEGRKIGSIIIILMGKSLLREVVEGRMIGKRPRGGKRLGVGLLNEFLKESSYAEKNDGKQERMESMETKNLPNSRALMTILFWYRVPVRVDSY